MGNFWALCCRIIFREGFQVSFCCYLKKLGIFGSKLGTKLYAFAYNEGRLEKGSNFQREPLSFLVSCFCLGFRLDQ